jgi:hypothetical protein
MKRSIVAAIGILVLATVVVAQEGKRVWNFDSDKTGSIAKGFSNEVGDWKVVTDATAPSQPNALAQLAQNRGSTFNLTLVEATNYKDLEITVKMKAVAGKEDQGGGLVWRAKDAKNYYVARYNPLEDNYNLYKMANGRRSEIKGSTAKRMEGWHTLTVSMKGDLIECLLDGRKYIEAKDSTFGEAGKIGLWTKSDAQSHFDDLTTSGK